MDRALLDHIGDAVRGIRRWEERWGRFEAHPSLRVDRDDFSAALEEYLQRLAGSYPFFHPRYAGQMLKPPHAAAVVGYLAAMLINPNNHALDGGPATSELEKEVVKDLARMFGFDGHLGHLTSGGTIANLEALWVARELQPGRAIAYSTEAHYTHARMCGVLGVEGRAIPTDRTGAIDVDALELELKKGDVGTVVATAGTTGFGIVDDIPAIVDVCRRFGARIHVDAAYGGFFRVLVGSDVLGAATSEKLATIADCDSVVIDPHKHGLQPYGCGAVLFADPGVGRIYKHDSPYTYFTSDALHLGEISLECSRAGAAAGALWLTLQMLPLERESGFGPILSATLKAAKNFARRIEQSPDLELLREPELDIVTFHPAADRLSEIDRLTMDVFNRLMEDEDDPIFLSVLNADGGLFPHSTQRDVPHSRVLRSVLKKPEHENEVGHLADRIEQTLSQLRSEAR